MVVLEGVYADGWFSMSWSAKDLDLGCKVHCKEKLFYFCLGLPRFETVGRVSLYEPGNVNIIGAWLVPLSWTPETNFIFYYLLHWVAFPTARLICSFLCRGCWARWFTPFLSLLLVVDAPECERAFLILPYNAGLLVLHCMGLGQRATTGWAVKPRGFGGPDAWRGGIR